ncbi:hypothetical protein [Paucilactobacillus kaifaensis]|uniref:hypothetical protein n=1 Tax=Paucilactobacillus kaifaensis TaxID=2559921 RepID=UPI0010F76FFB|nr:hypothetical protein [Paucilactobacillus kaifaensis]
MNSNLFSVKQNERGALTLLSLKSDKSHMNWLIDPDYLATVNYHDDDKLFGEFTVTIDGKTYNSIDYQPQVKHTDQENTVIFEIQKVQFLLKYSTNEIGFTWNIELINNTGKNIKIENLGVWASLAYVMYRDKNVHRNANQSTAVFPSISTNFTKLAAVRRDNTAPNMGLYQTKGQVMSVGTYNEYSNRFFENVSPSLDGMLFHQIILAGGYPQTNGPKHDWIYSQAGINLDADETREWGFCIAPFSDQSNFYEVAKSLGHPIIKSLPMVTAKQPQVIQIDADNIKNIASVCDRCFVAGKVVERNLTAQVLHGRLEYEVSHYGEHQVVITFKDGKQDMLVFNKLNSVKQLLRNRADYISSHSYTGPTGKQPYSFGPVSNQGESLGKMTFVIQECLLDPQTENIADKIRQVEESAVKYVRPRWFVDGDFKQPRKLYGEFYRVMDLEYIAHLFYLLSQCDQKHLQLYSPKDYLIWAAQVFDVRVNPDFHDNERGKSEAQMLGQYFLYIDDLLQDLKKNNLESEYEEISASWQAATTRIAAQSKQLSAAMTEHFFDNAGFGPAAGALALAGQKDAAKIYGELLKANIGFSNDFRAQSPDRWWEALSYMIHSLWGGVTAASALIAGRELKDAKLVEAAYRGTVAVLYMYDSNATATDRHLKPGEAASTYSIAGPNLNRPDLSRNRFGQSIFAADGGIFSKLFPDGYTGEDDWDMGEELVAYLNGFGQETYIYERDGEVQVVNGKATAKSATLYEIESFAPYPQKYINLSDGSEIKLKQNKVLFNRETQKFG